MEGSEQAVHHPNLCSESTAEQLSSGEQEGGHWNNPGEMTRGA